MTDDRPSTRSSAWGFASLTEHQEWMERGSCAQTDPEAFFPEKGGSTREAKRICVSCPVQEECLDYALDNDERFGIWGGYSERERRRLKAGEPVERAAANTMDRRPNGHGFKCPCYECDHLYGGGDQ